MPTCSPNPNFLRAIQLRLPEVEEKMVTKLQFHSSAIYLCEVCGYGYRKLGTAEHCEQHCDTEMYSSARIRQKAVYQPKVEIIPAAPTSALQHQLRRTHA